MPLQHEPLEIQAEIISGDLLIPLNTVHDRTEVPRGDTAYNLSYLFDVHGPEGPGMHGHDDDDTGMENTTPEIVAGEGTHCAPLPHPNAMHGTEGPRVHEHDDNDAGMEHGTDTVPEDKPEGQAEETYTSEPESIFKPIIIILIASVSLGIAGLVLVDLETLVEWEILPSCFPLPIDENDREVGRKVRNVQAHPPKKLVEVKERAGSWRTSIRFNQIAEEEYEKDHEMAVYNALRGKLLKMY